MDCDPKGKDLRSWVGSAAGQSVMQRIMDTTGKSPDEIVMFGDRTLNWECDAGWTMPGSSTLSCTS
jgi:hypothetical protein